MTRYLTVTNLGVPGSKKVTEFLFQVRRKNPRGAKSTNPWSRFSFPPSNCGVNCLESQGTKRFLYVLGQASEGIAHSQSPFCGSKESSGIEPRQCVGSKRMDKLPHRETVLEPVGQDDILDNLRGETVSCPAPKGCQPKLGIHIHLRFLQKAFSRVVELANKRKIQLRLPFLNEGQLHRTEIISSSEQRNRTPNEEIVVILPVSKRKLSLHQSIILKLQEFPKSAVFPMKNSMGRRANVEFRLEVGDMSEPNVHCIRLKKRLRETTMRVKIGAPHGAKICTAFQYRSEFGIRVQAMDNRQDHQSALSNPKMEKER